MSLPEEEDAPISNFTFRVKEQTLRRTLQIPGWWWWWWWWWCRANMYKYDRCSTYSLFL